jgi:uncharacterized protein (TIGR02466 family)
MTASFSNLEVQPLFATPLAMFNLKGDPTLTTDWTKTVSDWEAVDGVGITPGYNFLAGFPELQRQLVETFDAFKANWLGMSNTEFAISSSWMTYVEPGAVGNSHRHYNSMFTGVYYPFPGEYSPLEISRTGLEANSFLVPRDDQNLYSMASVSLHPYQSLAVFFPSHVMHRISRNNGSEIRHSVAFNLCPTGDLNTGTDSSAHLIARPIT